MKKNNGSIFVEKKRNRKNFKNERKLEEKEMPWLNTDEKKAKRLNKQLDKRQKNRLGLEPEDEKALALNNKHYQNLDLSKIHWQELIDLNFEECANDHYYHNILNEKEFEAAIQKDIEIIDDILKQNNMLNTNQSEIKESNVSYNSNHNQYDSLNNLAKSTNDSVNTNVSTGASNASVFFEPLKKIFNRFQIQKGFSLLELMVVMAIIGVLSTIAIPAFRDYIIRAKVTELLTLAQPARLAVTENLMAGTAAAQIDNAKLGLSKIENKGRVKEISVAAGIINIIANSKELGLEENKVFKISLTPSNDDASINWKCNVEPIEYKKYVPENCRG